MSPDFHRIFAAAKIYLLHDKVQAGDSVLVVADTGTYEPLLEAVFLAALDLGAQAAKLIYPAPARWLEELPPLVEQAMYQAHYTFILPSQPWFYNITSERFRGHLRTTGKRSGTWEGIADAVPHFLSLLPGDQDVIERSRAAAKLLFGAKDIKVTSRTGTHLLMDRGDPTQQRMNNPVGQVNYSPLTIDARMAIARGDRTIPPIKCSGTLMLQGAYRTLCPGPAVQKGMIRQPVRIEIEQGRITHIARDTTDGVFLDDWFRSWNDPATCYIDHFNIGVDHRIQLENLDNLSVHRNYGGLLMGFGLHFSSNRGDPGVFRSKAHIECHLTGANLHLDDKHVIQDGEFTDESGIQRAERFRGTGSPYTEVEGHVLPELPKF